MKIEQQGNNSLRVLSVLTAILMPPTLVTGVFGVNTKGLPFTDLDTAFLWASLLMVLSSVRCLPHHEAHRDHQVV